jgi:hypothetical protein
MVPVHRSANVLATGVRTGLLRILRPSVRKISSKVSMNWLPRSRTRARESASWLAWRRNRLRAAWVVQAPVGLVVEVPAHGQQHHLWREPVPGKRSGLCSARGVHPKTLAVGPRSANATVPAGPYDVVSTRVPGRVGAESNDGVTFVQSWRSYRGNSGIRRIWVIALVMAQEDVGKFVVAAIEANRIHILTHPRGRSFVEARAEQLSSDFDYFATIARAESQ